MAKTINTQTESFQAALAAALEQVLSGQQDTADDQHVQRFTARRNGAKQATKPGNVSMSREQVDALSNGVDPADFLLSILDQPKQWSSKRTGQSGSTYYWHTTWDLLPRMRKVFPDMTMDEFIQVTSGLVAEKLAYQYPTKGGFNLIASDHRPTKSTEPKTNGNVTLDPVVVAALKALNGQK
jgi:hypothetical protein